MNYLISEDYLMHHGVKGMKWGVRHDPERSAQKAKAKVAKGKLKAARKQYNKDFNSAYRYANRHPISTQFKNTKTRKESERRWKTAYNSAKKVNTAKKNYRKTAGVAADRRDTAAQVGKVLAASAVAAGGIVIATNPVVARSVGKAMATGLGSIAKNAKRGASYMAKTRYNKASQLGTLANAVKNSSKFEKAATSASRSAAKSSSYRSMNKRAKNIGRNYRKATSSGPRSIGEAVRNAGSRAKSSAKSARDKAGIAKDSAYINARNAYADARTSASRTARRTSTNAKIVKEGVKDGARSTGNSVRRGASTVRTNASNRVTQFKNRKNPRLRSNNRNSRYTINR